MRFSSNRIPLTAVIGGAGKTCAAHLIRSVLERGTGKRFGLITTRHTYLAGQVLLPLAWPNWRERLDSTLMQMEQAGCEGAIVTLVPAALNSVDVKTLELERMVFTGRTSGVDGGVIRATLEGCPGKGICNLDDPGLRNALPDHTSLGMTYAERRGEAQLNARNLRMCADRIEFEALTDEAICRMRLPIPGGFGLYNALAALACGLHAGLTLDTMAGILPSTSGVEGRMELLPTSGQFDVLIDSAGTPEQVDNLLMAARGLAKNRLILVLGAPGDRDRKTRPLLGEAASRADLVILTEDDPRTESPEEICAQIQAGMVRPALIEPDRTRAVEWALELARPGDLVLLSGRGDKKEMLTGQGVIPLDERQIVKEYFHKGEKRKRMDT